MADVIYNRFKLNLIEGDIDLENNTITVLLLTSSYTPDADHDVLADVSTYELSGGNYARKTLSGKNLTQDDANDRAVFDADDVSWSSLTAADFRYVILMDDDNADQLIYCADLGAAYGVTLANLYIRWNASGIFYLS